MQKMKYIEHIPRVLPEGKVLVHSHVLLQRPIGRNGSRMWIQDLDDTVSLCNCGREWWKHLPHYVPSSAVQKNIATKPPAAVLRTKQNNMTPREDELLIKCSNSMVHYLTPDELARYSEVEQTIADAEEAKAVILSNARARDVARAGKMKLAKKKKSF